MSNAALTILDNLVWDRNPPEVEQALATDEATRLLRHELTDRVGILRVVAALRHSLRWQSFSALIRGPQTSPDRST